MSSLLYGVSAVDAVSFGSAVALVLSVIPLASLIPAWRAARLNPVLTLLRRS